MFLFILIAFVISSCTRSRDKGNVLRVAIREKFKTLDPAQAQDYYSGIVTKRAYEGLVQYHYLKRPYEIIPSLAESLPQISKDRLTYTFKIKPGVHFQNDSCFKGGKGREIKASDFVYSFKRLADPSVSSPGWWILDGKIKGLNQWREKAENPLKKEDPIEGLKAIDDHTLQIVLTKPSPVFLHVLTMPYASVVAKEAVDFYGQDFARHPVGTGPFQLDYYSQNQLVWVKNPTYHSETYPSEGEPEDKKRGLLADAGKALPFLDKIVDDFIVEDQPAWLNFMQGNHDYLMRIPKDNEGTVFSKNKKPRKEMRDKGIDVQVTPAIEFSYIAFNMEDPVVGGTKNKLLRQAISLAYDEAPIIETFYFGMAIRAESPIPPGVFGYDPNYRNPYRHYNLSKARALLAKAGHPEGKGIPELVYDAGGSPDMRQIGEYFQRTVALLGIKVKLNIGTFPQFLNRIKKKQAQVWSLNWLLDYPDAENVWALFYSKNESPGSNSTNFKNSEYDKLYEKMITLADGPKKQQIFQKMRKIVAEEVPLIVTVHRPETRLVHSWTHNVKIHAFEHNIEKYIRVDSKKRTKALE